MNVSCAMALTQIMVSHLDLPGKIKDSLCAALVNPIHDYTTDVRVSGNSIIT